MNRRRGLALRMQGRGSLGSVQWVDGERHDLRLEDAYAGHRLRLRDLILRRMMGSVYVALEGVCRLVR